jgi:UDP-N-acetylglucosamine--N-acetylmuramyl-(pentapeptide) pyrophosphoryl-undecaprenol N-acetylglucosamine transferase
LSFVGQRGDTNIGIITSSGLHVNISTVFAGKFRRFHTLTTLQQIFNFGPNLLNTRDLFLVVIGFFESAVYLTLRRPDVIFFKGGFVVVPVGFAARLLRIPYVTHDSDALPGLANRLIAGGARYNAVATDGVTAYSVDKTINVGVPISPVYFDLEANSKAIARQKLGIPHPAKVLLIIMGTQGAKKVDIVLGATIQKALDKFPDLLVYHVFGRLNEAAFATMYEDLGQDYKSRVHKLKFVSNAHEYIAAADVVVGRAGATTLAEFAAIGRASIIVPADHLTGGHQVKNAQILADKNAIMMVRESSISDGGLIDAICALLGNDEMQKTLAGNLHRTSIPDSAAKIARLCAEVAVS